MLILDGAGWHRSRDLVVPDNLTLIQLPPYSPELNAMEQVFQFLKSNYLCNQVFATVEVVHTALAEAWNRVVSEAVITP